ncbi:MAG: HEAT repeat domain-containing protein [Acidobacteria bacterium]|nr:HEAT repeat domain-containing protein [Acidobacteriota bacterium]
MMILSKVFIDTPSRTMTLSLSAMGAAAVIVGFLIGGVNAPICSFLLFAGCFLFILAYAYRWQGVRKFKFLMLLSLSGFFVFAILHNLFEAYSLATESRTVVKQALAGLSVASFLIAILVCPAAAAVGLLGWIRRWWDGFFLALFVASVVLSAGSNPLAELFKDPNSALLRSGYPPMPAKAAPKADTMAADASYLQSLPKYLEHSTSHQLNMVAVWLLGRLGDKQAVGPLWVLLDKPLFNSMNVGQALVRLGDPRSIAPLLESLLPKMAF